MRNRILVLLSVTLFILGISGCKNTEQTLPVSSAITLSPAPPSNSHMDAYKSVFQKKAKFFSTDARKELDISQLNHVVSSDNSVNAEISKFAVIDLDNDGTPEVVLSLTVNKNDYFGFEVFRYQDGVVYGYTLWYRSFMELKDDGTFSYSGGAADHGFGTIMFTKDGYTINEITYSESGIGTGNNETVSYFVNRESASQEDFLSAVSKQDEKPGVIWYDFTDDNIETLLSD